MRVVRVLIIGLLACCAAGTAFGQAAGVSVPYFIVGTDNQQREQAICYNPELNEYLVAYWDCKTSYSVPGVSAYLLNGDGTRKGSEIIVKQPDIGAGAPCIAYNSVDDRYLVTFVDYLGDLYGQLVRPDGSLEGGNFLIYATTCLEPDLAYCPTTNKFLLTWRDDHVAGLHDVYSVLLGGNGHPVDAIRNVTDFTSGFAGNPKVVCNPDLNQFLVVIQNAVTEYGDIYARLVDASTGALAPNGIQMTNTDNITERNAGADYDPDNHRFLVVYERLGYQDAMGQFVAPNGTNVGSPFNVTSPRPLGGPSVAYNSRAKEFLIVFGSWIDESNWARRVSASGMVIGLPVKTNGSVAGFGNFGPIVVPNVSTSAHDYLVCWQNNHTDVWDSLVTLNTYVTSSSADGAYGLGKTVNVRVIFDRPVTATGSPYIELETGAVDRNATYVSGSGTNALDFTYTVQAGDANPSLDYKAANSLKLNGGTIKDSAGNNMDLTLPAPGADISLAGMKDISVDSTNAIVTGITSDSADGSYKTGIIPIKITFSDTVNVTGLPRIELETGATNRFATCTGTGSGTNTLTFNYQVQTGDSSPDLDYVAINSLTLNGGTIRDPAGNDANLTLPQPGTAGSLAYNKNLVIDAEKPAVQNVTCLKPNGVYKAGERFDVLVRFNEVVNITGTPQLELETGSVDRRANYSSGTGTDTLTFVYTVQPGDSSSDLDYKATGSLTLNGGTIRDWLANNAILTLPALGAAGSLGANRSYAIIPDDGTIASVKGLAIDAPVHLGDKILYLSRSTFGYIEESGRTTGIRIEGALEIASGQRVCLVGTRQVTPGGEPCIAVTAITANGPAAAPALGASNRSLISARLDGLHVGAWGCVISEPTGNAFWITDGSDPTGIKVICDGAPGVIAGQYVTIFGAAGRDGDRVIYKD